MSKRSSRQREKRPIEEPRSQTARAPEGDPEIFANPGPSDQENSLTRHARVREDALAVDPTDRRARIKFIASLGPGRYVRGETPAVLADAWGLKLGTVENDASVAWVMIGGQADPEVDRAMWWRSVYDLLDQAKRDGELVSDCIDGMRDPSGRLVTNEMGLKMIADAQGRARDSVVKVLDSIAKATGLAQSAPLVVVNMGGKPERIDASEVARFAERAHAFMAERHPELVAEFLEYVGAGDVPALTVGGGQ